MFEIPFNKWFSLQCRFNTEINVVHLCWDKQLMETCIINCICSCLSQLWTVVLWHVHVCQSLSLFYPKNGRLLWHTSQLHMHIWRVFSIHDTRLINLLKSLFSIIFGFPQPIFVILYIIQFGLFLYYKAIKFGEYNHQWHCEMICELQVPSMNVGVFMDKVMFATLKNTTAEKWS